MISVVEGSGPSNLSQVLLKRYQLRVRPETEAYVLAKLRGSTPAGGSTIPVIGGDARTGVPQRMLLPAAELLESFASGRANA